MIRNVDIKKNKELNTIGISNLCWRPDNRQREILKDISLNINSGDFYGILGPNGAGKTSFVRQLINLLPCTHGEIKYDEINIDNLKRQEIARQVSFLPQETNHNVDYSVWDMVSMGREPYRKTFQPLAEEDICKINEAIELTDLEKIKVRSFEHLSGGEKQRVIIARLIAQDTPWIILDEPLTGLDVKYQSQLLGLLLKLRERKKVTIISIFHDINIAANCCSKIILMKNGTVQHFGNTKDVITKENLENVYEVPFDFVKLSNTCSEENKFVIIPQITGYQY